jgi:hypothetical protein
VAIVVPTPNTTITSAWGKSVADALNKWPAPGAGAEIVYAQITAPITVTSTAAAAAHTFVDGGPATYDGSPVVLEAFSPYVTCPAGGGTQIGLWDGATFLTILGQIGIGAGSLAVAAALNLRYRFTPSAGSHAYKTGTWVSTGSGQVMAGTGTGGGYVPGFLRITRA